MMLGDPLPGPPRWTLREFAACVLAVVGIVVRQHTAR